MPPLHPWRLLHGPWPPTPCGTTNSSNSHRSKYPATTLLRRRRRMRHGQRKPMPPQTMHPRRRLEWPQRHRRLPTVSHRLLMLQDRSKPTIPPAKSWRHHNSNHRSRSSPTLHSPTATTTCQIISNHSRSSKCHPPPFLHKCHRVRDKVPFPT